MSHSIFPDRIRIVVESSLAAAVLHKVLDDVLGPESRPAFEFHTTAGHPDALACARSVLATDDRVVLVVNAWGAGAAAIAEQRRALETALGEEDAWSRWIVVILEPAIEGLLFEDGALRRALLGEALTAEQEIIARYEPRKVIEHVAPELLKAHVLEQRLAPLDCAPLAELPSLRALLSFVHWGVKDQRMGPVHDLIHALFATLEPEREHVVVLGFRYRGEMIPCGHKVIASGPEDMTFVSPASVFCAAMQLGAFAILVAHNHPSGSREPSDTDRRLTADLVAMGRHLCIDVLDHVIHTRHGHTSLCERCPELFARRPAEDAA